jgi:hypothetical protein
MKAALAQIALFLLIGSSSADAQSWIALWQDDDEFLGMMENGDVYRYVPATGATQFAGSMGSGPWVSFGRNVGQLLALQPSGQVWGMNPSSGVASLFQTLPSDREWCALQQHPDIYSWFVISCDGQIWSLYEPVRLLADFGLCAPGRWICVANADDSYFATRESGDTWQGTFEYCAPAGSFGPGPWVGFSRNYVLYSSFLALKSNGEIWAHGWASSPPSLYLELPADREWCGFLTGPAWGTGPGYALTCSGEIWTADSPPALVGSFVQPTPIAVRTWGEVKAAYH